MAQVFIPVQLRGLTGGEAQFNETGVTVREIVGQLEARFPGLSERLCVQGELAPGLQVSIDGVFSRRGLDAAVRPESEVHFLPVFGGG